MGTPISRWLVKAVLAGVMALVAMPSPAQAQGAESVRSVWMAASSNDASLTGPTWGRLTMTAGYLIFQSSNYEWSMPLAEVKRISSSNDRAFAIESVTGERYYVGILNTQMTFTSARWALQMIRRAVRDAPSSAASRPTMVAGGGGRR
jgi:hypothetical protein